MLLFEQSWKMARRIKGIAPLPIINEQLDRETRSIKTRVFMSARRWEKMKRGNRWSAIGVKWADPRREWNGKNDGGETLFIRG